MVRKIAEGVHLAMKFMSHACYGKKVSCAKNCTQSKRKFQQRTMAKRDHNRVVCGRVIKRLSALAAHVGVAMGNTPEKCSLLSEGGQGVSFIVNPNMALEGISSLLLHIGEQSMGKCRRTKAHLCLL